MSIFNIDLQDDEGNSYRPMANPDSQTEFTKAGSRTNIASGDSFRTAWGKICKFFADLGTSAFSGLANNLTTTAAGYGMDARQGPVIQQKFDQINSNLQELREGMMKIATKTVSVTTGNSGSTYQNEIDLNDMGLDINKIVACYFEPSNAGIGLTGTGGGQCTLAKNYNTATGKLIISIGSTTYCRAMTWTGTVIAVTA